MYKDEHIKIEVAPCKDAEHRSTAGGRRRNAIRALQGRLDYLKERRDQRGIVNSYISQEISGLEWALILLQDEYEAFKDANKDVTEAPSDSVSSNSVSSDSDLVSLANDSAED